MKAKATADIGNVDTATPVGAEVLLAQLANLFSFHTPPTALTPATVNEDPAEETRETPSIAARFRTLLEHIPAVIFTASLDQGLSEAYVSPHVETALGFTQEEWLGDPIRWYRQIHPDDRTRWSTEAAQLILTGQPLRSVYRVIARDGHIVWFQCEVKIVNARDGRPWFLHGAAFEITGLKETEAALQAAHAELEQRVHERTADLAQAISDLQQEVRERKWAQAELARTVEELKRANSDLEQFAYSACHDLQEPLRTASMYAQMLQSNIGGTLSASDNQNFTAMIRSLNRMPRLLADLRDFIQTSNEEKDPISSVDADAALRNALKNLTSAIESSGATVTHGPLPIVRMRPVHLEQLFQNLVGNAITYRRPAVRPRIHIRAEDGLDDWIFSVQDNGIGIDPRYKERVFGIFKRLHHSADYAGTGMGLAICKRIVERAGGRIWVESRVGEGSTFLFTLSRSE
jgi:PAS domain S-box-containing protein